MKLKYKKNMMNQAALRQATLSQAAMSPTAAHAFTLVEMLLALAVSSIIGLTVLLMLSGASTAAQTQHDTREATVTRQVVVARLSSLTRCTAVVLAKSDSSLVLWKGDMNANNKPDLSELRRIEWDSDSKEIWVSESPVDMNIASDVVYGIGDDFSTLSLAAAGTAVFPTQVILGQIQGWSVTLDEPVSQDARLLRLDVQLTHGSGNDTATIISALRASGI